MIKILSIVILSAIPLVSGASQKYASISTYFKNGQCEIFTWITNDGGRTKFAFNSKASKRDNGSYSCEVSIPIKEFEKTFEVCFLSRIAYTREGNSLPFSAEFSGGVANGRDDIYWFQWSDAEYTHAGFICVLK